MLIIVTVVVLCNNVVCHHLCWQLPVQVMQGNTLLVNFNSHIHPPVFCVQKVFFTLILNLALYFYTRIELVIYKHTIYTVIVRAVYVIIRTTQILRCLFRHTG